MFSSQSSYPSGAGGYGAQPAAVGPPPTSGPYVPPQQQPLPPPPTSSAAVQQPAYTPAPAAAPAVGSKPPAAVPTTSGGPVQATESKSWNDPPPIQPRAPQAGTTYAGAPITSPLASTAAAPAPPAGPSYGAAPPTNGPPPNGNAYGQPPQQQQQQQQPYQPQQQQAPPMTMMQPGAPAQQQPPPQQQQPAPPPEPKPKAPIPDDLQPIHRAFEAVLERCRKVSAATTRRRVEDVEKRLEVLWDRLRERSVHEPVLGGLFEIARALDAGDFQAALAVHARLIASSNFDDVGYFMVGIKNCITVAKSARI